MKRSGPPARKTPLKSSPLERTTAWPAPATARSSLHANSAAQRHQPKRRPVTSGVPAKVRKALALRSGGLCEIGQRGCQVRAVDPAHRGRTGMGGRKGAALVAHHVLSNILHSCRACHERTHAHPAEAYAHGWMVREHQAPTTEPVLYRGVWRLLADDGSVLPTNPHNA